MKENPLIFPTWDWAWPAAAALSAAAAAAAAAEAAEVIEDGSFSGRSRALISLLHGESILIQQDIIVIPDRTNNTIAP